MQNQLTIFQRGLLEQMTPGVWYDFYENQGTGGEALPEWFHRQTTQPLQTLVSMARKGYLQLRNVELNLPQAMRPE